MAATSDDFTHRIGLGSTYDSQMEFTENIIRSYKFPENETYQYIVFSYYMSRAYSYFEKSYEYIHSDQPLKDFLDGATMYLNPINNPVIRDVDILINNIKANFSLLEKKFNELINNAKKNYTDSKVVKSADFMEIFYFISLIFCFYPIEKILSYSYKKYRSFVSIEMLNNKIYPLTDDNGLFAINCYLYALFSDLYLVGIPTSVSHYDGFFTCPKFFIEHDMDHSNDEYNRDDIEKFKKLYIAILEDPTLTQYEKELHILFMWYLIHEAIPDEEKEEKETFYLYKKENFRDIIDDIQLELDININRVFIEDFFPDFKRFSEFTINSETPFILYNDRFYLNKILKNHSFSDYDENKFYEILNDPKYKNEDIYKVLLCYASFLYSFNQISIKFFDLIIDIENSENSEDSDFSEDY
jgi:hypothetical protein